MEFATVSTVSGGSYYLRLKVAGKPIRGKLNATSTRVAEFPRDQKAAGFATSSSVSW